MLHKYNIAYLLTPLLLSLSLFTQAQIVNPEAPRLESITRIDSMTFSPLPENTNADILDWLVVFSENVREVDETDFEVSNTSADIAVVQVVGDARSYRVTASMGDLANLDARVLLSIADSNDIEDLDNNELIDITAVVDAGVGGTGGAAGDDLIGGTGGGDALGGITDFVGTGLTDIGTIGIGDTGVGGTGGAAGGISVAPTIESYLVDNTAPTVTIDAPTTTSGAFTVNIDFGEPVTTFAEAGIGLNNAMVTPGSFAVSGATSYTAEITPNAGIFDGASITISISADVADDLAGNRNLAAIPVTVLFSTDTSAPELRSIIRDTPPGEFTNADTLIWGVDFSEAVTNVDPADFMLTSVGETATGILLEVIVISDASYLVTASRGNLNDLDATVSLSIGAGHDIEDIAGRGLRSTAPIDVNQSYEVDNTPPARPSNVISFSNNPVSRNVARAGDTITTFIVTTEITGTPTLMIAGQTVTEVTTPDDVSLGGARYQFDYEVPGTATQGLALRSLVILDLADNRFMENLPSTGTASVFIDTVIPTVTSITAPPTTSGDFMVDIEFSEDVTSFTAGDISLNDATVIGFTGTGTTYTATITPTASGTGTITIDIATDAAIDSVGNGNAAATQSVAFDITPPTVTIDAPPTTTGTFTVTIEFSEDVTDFTPAEITLDNAMASSFSGTGTTYTATITPSGTATITINIAADVAIDSIGNGNEAAIPVSVDFVVFSVTRINRFDPPLENTNADSLTWSVVFSEPATNVDMDATDFAVSGITGGTIAAVLAPGLDRTYRVTASGGNLATFSGIVSLSIDTSNDIENNAGVRLASIVPTGANESYIVDNRIVTPPTVMIDAPTQTSGAFPITIRFSEDVTDFTQTEITLDNAIASSFSGTGTTYTATITPSGTATITINIAADVAIDSMGDGNTAAAPVSVDSVVFSVTRINRFDPPLENTNADSLTWSVVFSEPVDNVNFADFAVSGTTGGTITVALAPGADRTYRVTASEGDLANLDGTVSLSIDALHDIENTAGNDLMNITPADPQSYMVDNTEPMISETTAVATPTNNTRPEYVFNSDEAGTISYGGACSSTTTRATDSNNAINFNQELPDGSFIALEDGEYTDCTITVTDAAGNESDPRLLPVTPFTIDIAGPTVETITVAADSYGIGQTVAIEVIFSEPVEVVAGSGTPVLSLNNNGGQAVYSSMSGTNTLTFNYEVLAGQGTDNLDVLDDDALTLAEGERIRDISGNPATPSLALTDTSGLGNAIIIAPGVILVSGESGNYQVEDRVTIDVQFSEPVTVSGGGELRLELETGDVDRMAEFSTTTDITSDTLAFIYTVQEGDRSQDLAYTNVNALVDISGASITSADPSLGVGLTLPALDAPNSLAGSSEIVIGVLIEEQNARLNEMLLPKIAQAISAATVDGITRRIEGSGGDGQAVASSSLSAILPTGLASLKDLDLSWLKSFAYNFLTSKAEQSARSGSIDLDGILGSGFDIKRVLGNSEFVMPLNASGDNTGSGVASNMVLWGNGNYSNLSDNDDGLDYDGDIYSINVGIDRQIDRETLLGVSVNWSNADFDYRDAVTVQAGDYGYRFYGINPYISWSPQELSGANLWATVGYGIGEIESQIEGVEKVETDTRQYQFSGGGRYILTSSADSLSQLSIKGDLTLLRIDVDRSEGFLADDIDSQSFRLLLQGSSVFDKGSYSFSPSLEGGLRYDSGDGDTGGGIELSPAFTYKSLDDHILIEGRGRYLIAGQHDQWGLSVLARIDQARHGRGLSLSMHPTWGQSQAQAEQLTAYSGSRFNDYRAAKAEAQMKTELSYGMHMSHILGQTMLFTPYAELTLGENARYYQFGQRLSIGELLSLSFKLGHHQRRGYADDNHLGLESTINF